MWGHVTEFWPRVCERHEIRAHKNCPCELLHSVFSLCTFWNVTSQDNSENPIFWTWQCLLQHGYQNNSVEQSTLLMHPFRLHINEKELSITLRITFQHLPVIGAGVTLTDTLLCKGGRQLPKWLSVASSYFLVSTPLCNPFGYW